MMVFPSAEHRPLKRQKLGPPDVYPQDAKQREDELDDFSVKQGFTHRPQIQDEYGSALTVTLNSAKVADNFNMILKKKAELNQLPDTGRKKQQINIKDNFWLVTLRSKTAIEAWFKDLAGSKPLTSLAKKVPIFPKREDMLLTLCEYAVPVQRAIWFIKMTSFYHESKVAESKIKKKQQPDLSQDVTLTLTRFLREQLCKITDAYGISSTAGNTTPGGSTPGSSSTHMPGSTPPGSTTPGSTTPSSMPQPPHSSPHQGIGSSGSSSANPSCAQLNHNLRNWNYIVQMMLFMYQDGLLDRQEVLEWVVDNITRYRSSDQDSSLRVVLPLGLQYLDEITHSEYLSRKLTYFSTTKLSQMCQENGYNPAAVSSSSSSCGGIAAATGSGSGTIGGPSAAGGSGGVSTAGASNSATATSACNPATPQPSGSTSCGSGVTSGAGGCSGTTSVTATASTSAQIHSQATTAPASSSSSVGGVATSETLNPALAATFQELLACNQHRPIVLALSAFIQAVTLDCSTALVWNHGGSEKRNLWLCGSPLDHLPCAPSQLPMPPRFNNQAIINSLCQMEGHLKHRSRAAENMWSLDKYSINITGWTINRVLAALDALDRHSFDRVDASHSLDVLYAKIFVESKEGTVENGGCSSGPGLSGGSSNCGSLSPSASAGLLGGGSSSSAAPCGVGGSGSGIGGGGVLSGSSSASHSHHKGSLVGGTWPECGDGWEDAVVTTVCQWAVTVQRCGEHRAMAAAKLLEKRQTWLLAQGNSSGSSSAVPYYTFQNLLFKFLDTQAPVFDDCKTSERSKEFSNLVLLFSELIRHDVFSHDGYMCTLISRGDLADPPALLNPPTAAAATSSAVVPGVVEVGGHYSEIKIENHPPDNIDEDLGKILQTITKDADGGHESPPPHHNSPAPPPLAAMDEERMGGPSGGFGRESISGGAVDTDSSRPQPLRHLVYSQHFPLPSDDCYSHEINQRYVLLYGVGKARDEARHAVKKLTKEILKLFSKKFSIDVTEGGKVKKSSRGEFSFESLLSRFSQLSYFDQHVITNTVAAQVVEMLCGCGSGSSNYLPLLDHVAFLMDLMETSLNIHELLHLCCQVIKEIVEVEAVLAERQCLVVSYCPQLTLLVMGVVRKYNKCLLVSQEQTTLVFEGLLRLVKHVSNPAECSSADRIVLACLHSLYTSCAFIKAKHQDTFAGTASRIRQALSGCHTSSDGKSRRNPHVLEEYLANPRLRMDIPSVKAVLADPGARYSFACNAVLAAVAAPTNTRLNDIAVLCAEMTACSNALSSEWLGILNVLCSSVSAMSSNIGSSPVGGGSSSTPYADVVAAVDLRDPRTAATAHASLSVFTAVLIARDCFSFEELLNRVVIHSLKAAWNNGKGNPEVEPGARLSCHLLLRIFQSIDSSQPAQYCPGSPTSGGSGGVGGTVQRSVRLSCDRHLLVAAHLSFSMEPVLAFLKAMLIVSDAMSGQSKGVSSCNNSSISDILGTSYMASGSDFDIGTGCVDKAPLSDFARYALRLICSQDWVREICLKCPEKLCNSDNLLDSILTPSQAQRVLHTICHPESNATTTATSTSSNSTSSPNCSDQRQAITNILQDLDEWRLRISWLDLHLMYEQLRGSQVDLNQWLENVAYAAIQVFCQSEPYSSRVGNNGGGGGCVGGFGSSRQHPSVLITDKTRKQKHHSMDLIAPLISKLPKAVQSRVLKVSSQVLNAVTFGAYSSHKPPVVPQPGTLPGGGGVLSGGSLSNSSSSLNGLGSQSSTPTLGLGSNNGCSGSSITSIVSGLGGSGCNSAQIPVHSQRPFLQLMLMCLEAAQHDTIGDLLESLRMQLMQPVTLYKELGRNRGEVDPNKRRLMLEALRLRFRLIGGLFDVIMYQCSNVIITEWATLLVQLVVSGVIDLSSNSELFTTVLDMLAALVHSTLVSEPGTDSREENRRHYFIIVKKIKKELGEFNNVSVRLVRQLIPLPKVQVEVVVMEPWGSITDTKGNRHQDFDKDKKHGVQGAKKQELSPWDLLEGHRNPAPLSWAWLSATRLTRKTLKYHDTHQLLRFHTHTQQKSLSYFLEPPPLPPEDLEPVPEKQVLLSQLPCLLKEEVKAPDTPTSDHSPRGGTKRGGGGAGAGSKSTSNRRRKPRATPQIPAISQQPQMPMSFQQPNYSGVGPGVPVTGGMTQVPQWGGTYQPQLQPQQQPPQPPQQQPQAYYQQLPPGSGPPRYPVYSHSRSAIRQVVLERQHGMSGGMINAGGQAPPQQQPPPGFVSTMGPMMNPHQGGPIIRQQLRGAMPSRPQQAGMYPGTMQGVMSARQAAGMAGQPGQMYGAGAGGPGAGSGLAAQYGAYQQGPMMSSAGVGATTASMMGSGYQQGGYQSPAMMGMRQPQQPPGYMSQGQMVQRPPQYMQTTAGGGTMAMMSGGQAYARPGMGAMGGAAGAGSLGATAGMGGTTMGPAVAMGGGAGGMGGVTGGMGGVTGGMGGVTGGMGGGAGGMGGVTGGMGGGAGGMGGVTGGMVGGAGGMVGGTTGMVGGTSGMVGGAGGGDGSVSGGMMHHRMMMTTGQTSTSTGNTQQQSQLLSHMQRTMAGQQGQQQQAGVQQQQQQQQQQAGQQQQTQQQADQQQQQQQQQQQEQQAQRQTMMAQGRGYSQAPY